MRLGNFSVSLAVKDIAASRAFYEKLGFKMVSGDQSKNWIVLKNEAGQPAIAYNVFRCWVSEYQALPELDAGANAVAIQTIKLETEGWMRDPAVTEPTET